MKNNKRQATLRWAVFITVVGVLGGLWLFFSRVPDAGDSVAAQVAAHIGFQAPAFTLTTLDGATVTLEQYRGKIVLVNFWATWCPPCRTEMPDLQAVYQANPDRFVLLAIDSNENDTVVKNFVTEFKLTFPIVMDRDGTVTNQYSVKGLPTSFFIDRAGIVRATNVGGMNRAYIETQLDNLEAR